MKRPTQKEYIDIFTSENILGTFQGKTYCLKFYDKGNYKFFQLLGFLDAKVHRINDTYYIAMDKEWFLEAINNNTDVLLEIEQMLSFYDRKASYFPIFYQAIGVFMFFLLSSSIIVGSWFYTMPFLVQVLVLVLLIVGSFLGLTWAVLRHRKYRIYNGYGTVRFLQMIKNTEYREKNKEYVKQGNSGVKWYLKEIGGTPKISIMHHYPKIVFGNAIIRVLIIIGLVTMFSYSMNTPVNYLAILIDDILERSQISITSIQTPYELTSIEESSSNFAHLYVCGNYFCTTSGDLYTDFDTPYDISIFLEPEEEFNDILAVEENRALIWTFLDEAFQYKVVNLETQTIEYIVSKASLSYEEEEILGWVAFFYEDILFIAGSLSIDTERRGYVVKVDENGIIEEYSSTNGRFVLDIVNSGNHIYIIEFDLSDSSIMYLKELDWDLNLVSEKVESDSRLYGLMKVDGEIYVKDNYRELIRYSTINNDLSLKPIIAQTPFSGWIFASDNFAYSGEYLKLYKEFNSSLDLNSKGLHCNECTIEQYNDDYSFVKIGNQLYARNDTTTLVFTETDTTSYGFSRVEVSDSVPVIFILLMIVPIGVAHGFYNYNDKHYERLLEK